MTSRVFLTAPVAASLCAVVLAGAHCRGNDAEPKGPLGTPANAPAAQTADARPPDEGLTESEFAERLPGIDPSGLSAKQRSELSDLANDTFCPCAAKTVAGCLRSEPACKPAVRLVELAKKFIVGGRPASTTLVYIETYYASFNADRRKQVGTEGPRKGPENAKVTLVEFSDFECPACGAAHPGLTEVAKKYPTDVSIVFRNFPLPMHPNAAAAAAVGEYAFATGGNPKFWALADLFFANQRNLS